VVDRCGDCAPGSADINLFADGVSQLAANFTSKLPMSWKWVDCYHPGNVWVYVWNISSVEWFAVQAVNRNQV